MESSTIHPSVPRREPAAVGGPFGLFFAGRAAGVVALLVACAFLAGCAAWHPPRSGSLAHYAELEKRTGGALWTYDAPPCACPPTRILVIRNVQWLAQTEMSEKRKAELRQLFDHRLRKWLIQGLPPQVILLDNEDRIAEFQRPGPSTALAVDPAIVSIEEGSGLLRYLIGFGLGNAKMTIECRAVHLTPGGEEVRCEIAARTQSHGNPWFGLNLRSLSSFYCLRWTSDAAARLIAEHVLGLRELRAAQDTGKPAADSG